MKLFLFSASLLLCITAIAQTPDTARNIFIITTDGFRWQEVFNGADSIIISDNDYVQDTALTHQMYWASTPEARREKLMPFFWNVIARQGQLYGNRAWNNQVNVKNFYKISYPGYNEIFTGYADPRFNPNSPIANRNINVLEYINQQDAYKGQVVAFSSWNIMPYILNETRSHVPVNAGYENLEEDTDSTNILINQVQNQVAHKNNTRHDLLTYASAREYITQHHPKVVFLSLGETDEHAHHGEYDLYLQKANDVDHMIASLWYQVQTDPFYKNNTTFIITTDHGRGRNNNNWKTHGFWIKGSGETWIALLGAGITPSGEMKTPQQLWQKQIAATIAQLTGVSFQTRHSTGNHPIATTFTKEEIAGFTGN
ncbi:Metalloenzyme superfamily protein [Filimonas lacunae]|uniref:Metalloenzyme superfamily protein n=1 Tax=Filimonas lacunae TaxID=477680 RepID=A0A173MB78_9BACT|nr:alkaline phosphatase family protein [Filimonas lacunae]BAV04814.1 hypothetical protein FLA_0813 [Filimonas lacunae]SIT34725.1 Metalloenzyme superfamily protein [Filimonas lacunae]